MSEVQLWQETKSVDFHQCFKLFPIKKFLLAPSNLPAELYLLFFSPEKPSIQTHCMSSKGWEPCLYCQIQGFWFDLLKWRHWQLRGPRGGLFLGSLSQGAFPSSGFYYRFIQMGHLLCGRSSMWEVSWLGYWHVVCWIAFYPSATWTKKQKVVILWNFGLMPDLPSQAGKRSHLKKGEVGIP